MKKILIAGLFLLALLLPTTTPVVAEDITVTASPSYIEFGSSPTSWTLNDLTGSGLIDEDTVYYSNPLGDTTPPSATVVDGECYFTWANNSSVNITITVNCGHFTGGDADMTNSGTGSNGATSYGAYAWYSGMTYANKVVVASSGSAALYNTTTPGEDRKWGAEIETRTDSWAGTSASNTTMTITAVPL